jgi:hypothetical protein
MSKNAKMTGSIAMLNNYTDRHAHRSIVTADISQRSASHRQDSMANMRERTPRSTLGMLQAPRSTTVLL